jgi:hypothetical protein
MSFWSFGVVGRSDRMPKSSLLVGSHAQRGPLIFLNKEETLDLPGFVAQSRELPGLTGKDGDFIALENTQAIMEHIADLLTSNWKRGSQPPLVSSVCQLVLTLARQRNEFINK